MAEDKMMTAIDTIRNRLAETSPDFLRDLLHVFVQSLMESEVDAQCGAGYGVRSPDRVTKRNGYRSRPWDTRLGSIELDIPKLRKGSYFPNWLIEPRRRGERALVSVVTEAYVLGISTRRVDDLVKTLGMEGMSKSQVSELAKSLDDQVAAFRDRPLDSGAYAYVWVDALAVKCREGGRVVNVAVVIATGVNAEGHREVLGVDVMTSEDGTGWTAFLRGLVARGLRGVQLVTSDAHAGLQEAIASVLPGASWQRCRTHFMRNLLTRVPKSAQGAVATMVRSIFEQPSGDEVWAQHERVVAQLQDRFSAAAELLEEAAESVLAFTAFPKEHWRVVWSNNPQERVNKEVRRRTDVVGIFPNRSSIVRLVGALLSEQHDEWQVMRRYVSMGSLEKMKRGGACDPETGAQGLLPAPRNRKKSESAQEESRPPQAPAKRVGAKRRALTPPSTLAGADA